MPALLVLKGCDRGNGWNVGHYCTTDVRVPQSAGWESCCTPSQDQQPSHDTARLRDPPRHHSPHHPPPHPPTHTHGCSRRWTNAPTRHPIAIHEFIFLLILIPSSLTMPMHNEPPPPPPPSLNPTGAKTDAERTTPTSAAPTAPKRVRTAPGETAHVTTCVRAVGDVGAHARQITSNDLNLHASKLDPCVSSDQKKQAWVMRHMDDDTMIGPRDRAIKDLLHEMSTHMQQRCHVIGSRGRQCPILGLGCDAVRRRFSDGSQSGIDLHVRARCWTGPWRQHHRLAWLK